MGKRATFTVAETRRYIQAARAEDPRAVVEFMTPAGTVRIMPEPDPVDSATTEPHDPRAPIPWT